MGFVSSSTSRRSGSRRGRAATAARPNSHPPERAQNGKESHTMEPFSLTSSTFEDGGMVPENCTCDGANQSPALQWGGAPLNTQSFVLIVDAPDAPKGTFTPWVLFDIPKAVQTLDAGQPVVGIAGINDFQMPGYSGPCPPPGDRAHSYRFT